MFVSFRSKFSLEHLKLEGGAVEPTVPGLREQLPASQPLPALAAAPRARTPRLPGGNFAVGRQQSLILAPRQDPDLRGEALKDSLL